MKTSRIYIFKDVDMLLAARTIANNFNANLPELTALRTSWDESYALHLMEKIDSTIDGFLGINSRKELKEATESVTETKVSVLRDLIFLKTQIKIDHPNEAPKILDKLAYNRLTKKVHNGDQESLIELLYAFRKGMTDKLKAKICSNGINPVLIDRIVKSADQLKQFNTIQESLKKSAKQATGDVIHTFNEIYAEISGICKIARLFYKKEPLKQEQFTFSHTVKNMHAN